MNAVSLKILILVSFVSINYKSFFSFRIKINANFAVKLAG